MVQGFGRLYAGLFALITLAGGCQGDILITNDIDVKPIPNAPNLETPTKEDVVVQVTTPKVDILWVIDNSGSMGEEQQKLRDNFGEFMAYFLDSGLDYHIGVVSTDMDNNAESGKLQGAGGQRFVTPETPNPIETFRQMATLGTNGSSDERGRQAAWYALNDPLLNGFNADFYREEASLHIIVISDEHDYSGNDPRIPEFVNWLNTIKRDPDTVTFSGIIGPRGGCATADDGSEYRQVIQQVGGIEESICANDWSPILEQLGLQAAGLKREYFLSEVPVDGTIEVWVEQEGFVYNGVINADDCPTEACFAFTYDQARNSIVMEDFVPDPLAKVHIKYELLSGWQPVEEVQ